MSRYKELGVDVRKPGIEKFKDYIKNIYPNAFCVIQKDPEDPETGLVLHTDSAGSKPIQAYLHYRETGDAKWFKGLAQDSLAMNMNDIVCVGAEPLTFVDYIAYNPFVIERVALMGALSEGFGECIEIMREENVEIMFAGGETADLPDVLRSLDVSVTMLGRGIVSELITGEKVAPGDLVLGLRSGGEISYEKKLNSGIMSNGHTLARTSLMSSDYLAKYPELSHPSGNRFTGRFVYDDYLEELEMTVGEALLSPTRLYAPIIKPILSEFREDVHGMVHNTGGGQTKCLRLGKGINYVKNNLPEPDPIFILIQRESGVTWGEMYQDFNMGIGYELIVTSSSAEDIMMKAEKFGLGIQIIGYCNKNSNGNSLDIISKNGKFHFSKL
jgi:phosphoribosylformylglycinamidine cyclo-ligase